MGHVSHSQSSRLTQNIFFGTQYVSKTIRTWLRLQNADRRFMFWFGSDGLRWGCVGYSNRTSISRWQCCNNTRQQYLVSYYPRWRWWNSLNDTNNTSGSSCCDNFSSKWFLNHGITFPSGSVAHKKHGLKIEASLYECVTFGSIEVDTI